MHPVYGWPVALRRGGNDTRRLPGIPGAEPRRPSEPLTTVREAVAGDVADLVDLLRLGALVDRGEDPDDPAPYLAALEAIAVAPGSALLVADPSHVADPSLVPSPSLVPDRSATPVPTAGSHAPTVVGMCQLIVFRHFQARGGLCAELESVHVHPDWRGRGVGGLLVETAVARATAAGCYRVQLTSNAARSDAHRFYQRHGFEPSHVGFKRLLSV